MVRAPCMGACDRAPVCAVGHVQVMRASAPGVAEAVKQRVHAHAYPAGTLFDAYRRERGYRAIAGLPRRQADPRGRHRGGQRCRAARPRRRRLSDRAQMVAGARRAGAAPDGGQCRRGRARHLQGPALSRARPAPLHRRHADRRLGGRGGRDLHLYPRRISRDPADAAPRRSPRSRPRASPATPSCICGAAPAPISAAKSRP